MLVGNLFGRPIEWFWNKMLPSFEKPISVSTLVKGMIEEQMTKKDMEKMEREIEETENKGKKDE